MLPVMWLLFRNHPEDVGQHIDGAAGDTPNDRRHADATADVVFDLTAARRTRAYWCLIALHSVHGMVIAAVMFHRVQIFEDRGHTVGAHRALQVMKLPLAPENSPPLRPRNFVGGGNYRGGNYRVGYRVRSRARAK